MSNPNDPAPPFKNMFGDMTQVVIWTPSSQTGGRPTYRSATIAEVAEARRIRADLDERRHAQREISKAAEAELAAINAWCGCDSGGRSFGFTGVATYDSDLGLCHVRHCVRCGNSKSF